MTFPPFNTFFTINNILISVKRNNLTLVFFNAACHANLSEIRNRTRLSTCISRHLSQKFSNTSTNNNVSF